MKFTKFMITMAATTAITTSALYLNQQTSQAATKNIATTNSTQIARLYNRDGKVITNRALGPNTRWLVGEIVTINNQAMYQVATNEYLRSVDSKLDNSVDTAGENSTGDLALTSANISRYFVEYLNALHKANGTRPVQATADMNNYAMQRVNQQSINKLDHTTASRDTSENLEIGGFHDYRVMHMNAKQAAYYTLTAWYTERSTFTKLGNDGHFGHRAAILYSGPNVGLAVNEHNVAFVADWDYSTLDEFNDVYSYVGDGEPNNKWISADAI